MPGDVSPGAVSGRYTNEELRHCIYAAGRNVKRRRVDPPPDLSPGWLDAASDVSDTRSTHSLLYARMVATRTTAPPRAHDRLAREVDFAAASSLVRPEAAVVDINLDSQRQVIFNKIALRAYIPVYLAGDECTSCNTVLQRDERQNLRVCSGCAAATVRLVDSEHTASFRRPKRAVYYNRCSLYRKYLVQFHADAPPIPQEVIGLICRALFNIHILGTSKCRPTPVAAILRGTAHSAWAASAVRITRVINNDPPLILPPEIIDRLCERCAIIGELKEDPAGKCKFLNFEFLTKQFLCMENEIALAQLFIAHKTKSVLQRAEDRLAAYCRHIQQEQITDITPWFVTYTPG